MKSIRHKIIIGSFIMVIAVGIGYFRESNDEGFFIIDFSNYFYNTEVINQDIYGFEFIGKEINN